MSKNYSEAEEHERDARHLNWLRMVEAGYSRAEIAKMYKHSKASVIGQLNRIRHEYAASEKASCLNFR